MKTTAFTHSIKSANEDIYGVTQHGAFIMDGASALVDSNYTSAENDVVWMVHWWHDYLKAHLDHLDLPLHNILEAGVHAFNEAFSTFKPVESLSSLEQVSSALAVVRKVNGRLECFVLGDAEISLKDKTGQVQVITDDSLKHLDAKVIAMMNGNDHRQNFCVFKDFTAEELALLRQHRMQMNTKGGYYILAHDPVAIQNGIYHAVPLDSLESCLLTTDGISPLDRFYQRDELIEAFRARGLEPLVEELRKHEKEDASKVKLQRLKTHDDATVVLIEFEERGDSDRYST
jgi:serine/threonine protein phosphatase PrpC